MLTDEQLAAFERDGYLLIPDFFSADDCARLTAEARRLVGDFDLTDHPKTKFTTAEGVRQAR